MSHSFARLKAALANRYRLERELGAGGMATVYLAHDLRHDRNVAVKVLRPELVQALGSERFLQEIKVTAGLQHPHILPLFDSGEADSFLYYVMPYVEGETLRARLARDRELSVGEAVRITAEVADALDYAHRKDIVHRDIKPENILLHDGRALVADFGIALAVQQASEHRLTGTGLSVGTPQYMSPEQMAGDRELDGRSDIYALACTTYEMLAGEPPFSAASAQAVVARVMASTPPPLRAIRATVPPHVEGAVARALEKLPADRFAAAREFAAALTDPSAVASGTWSGSTSIPAIRHWRIAALAAAALAIGGALGWMLKPGPEPVVRRWALSFPEGQAPGLRTGGIGVLPDGSGIVYVVADTLGDADLYVRSFGALEGRPLRGADRAWAPQVSPDGRTVAWDEVGTGRGLRTASVDGGPRFVVTDSLSAPSWGLDGRLYGIHPELWGIARIAARGGPIEILTTRDSGQRHLDPRPMPNGKGVVFMVRGPPWGEMRSLEDARIAVLSLATRQIKVLTRGFWGRYAGSGHLVFARTDGRIYAAPFDPGRLELTGPPVPVADDVAFDPRGIAAFDLSANGTLVYVRGGLTASAAPMVWVDRSGKEVQTALEERGWREPRLARDGGRLANNGPSGDVVVHHLESGTSSRLTYGWDTWHVGWSPDGRDVIFVSDCDPTGCSGESAALYATPSDGSGPVRLLYRADMTIDEGTWSPDGTYLILQLWDEEQQKGTIVYTRPGMDTTLTRIGEGSANEDFPEISPDGRWLAYTAEEEGGREEVYVRAFPGPGGAWQVSREGGTAPLWAHSGRELFYVAKDSLLMSARVSADPGFFVLSREVLLDVRRYDYGYDRTVYGSSPDGRRFLFVKERYIGGAPGPAEVIVVENWFEELREKVGG